MMASFLEVVWTDPDSGRRGYLVIDRLVRGAASGGLRMRDGCTLDEVRDLARGMTLKEAIAYSPGDRYVPFGGAKGGIDCSPYDVDAAAVLTRYLAAMKPFLLRYWSTGEDFGVRQEALERIAASVGLRSTIEAALRLLSDPEAALARIRTAFGVTVDGVGLGDLVGGYGVAEAALAAAGRLALRGPGGGLAGEPGGPRAMVQGFGSMGGATARYLARHGVPVVGICDAQGVVADPDGLAVERLLLGRDAFGCMDRGQLGPAERTAPVDTWLDVPAEILVPAAMSYVITESNVDDVSAGLVVEAANVAVVPAAEQALAARGVTVLPDFVANVAANAWWWWTLFGDIEPDAADAFGRIATTLRGLSTEVLDQARQRGTTARAAALDLSAGRAAEVALRYG
jgi:glutamate dehydrogenase (NAD(P)+)